MGAVLAWNNLAKGASITVNSNAIDLPVANVANDSGSPAEAWQSGYGDVDSPKTVVVVKPGVGSQVWRVLGVFRTNLTANATVTFRLVNNPLSPVVVYISPPISPVAGYGQAVHVLPNDVTADYLTVSFSDASNPDGFINVPLLFAGPAFFPSRSIGFSSTVGRDVSRGDVTTRGGQEYPSLYWRRRRWNLQFESLLSSEVWGVVDDMLATADTGSNVCFAPDDESAYLQREAIFGRLNSLADISFPYQSADRRRWSAQITERL